LREWLELADGELRAADVVRRLLAPTD
jgi:hypothetical protein